MKKESSDRIIIQCFRASDFPEKCKEYSTGRDQVLIEYGFIQVIDTKVDWHKNSNTFIALAYYRGEPIAGMRLDVMNKYVKLPLEESISKIIPSVSEFIKLRALGLYAEGNGTWNAKKVSGLNLSQVLTRYLYAVALNLKVVTIFSFQAKFARRIVENYGAVRITEIGSDGWFPYPTEKYSAGIYLFENINVMNFKNKMHEERVRFLAEQLSSTNQQEEESSEIRIDYMLDDKVLC